MRVCACRIMASTRPPPPNAPFHSHDHGVHAHVPADAAGGLGVRRALMLALLLTAGFAVIEAIGGWMAGSLALLSDAGHMVTDAAALGLALFANAIGRRPPSQRASYGYGAREVLAAFVNAIVMLAVVAAIVIEAVRRLLDPTPVARRAGARHRGGRIGDQHRLRVAAVARAGVAQRARRDDPRAGRPAGLARRDHRRRRHHRDRLDADRSRSCRIVVSLLILRSTLQLLKQSTGVLMEGVPTHLDYNAIGKALARLPGVVGVHDLHVWNMTAERAALSAHIVAGRRQRRGRRRWRGAQRMLAQEFAIEHVTLQPDWPRGAVGQEGDPGARRASRRAGLASRRALDGSEPLHLLEVEVQPARR